MNKLLIILFLLFKIVNIFANGGVVKFNTPIIGVADPVLMNIREIKLKSEKLYIQTYLEHSIVQAVYELANDSDKDFENIVYAFPVEIERTSVSEAHVYQDSANLIDLNIFMNNEHLTIIHESVGDRYFVENYGYRSKKWYYTLLNITAHSENTLTVNYIVPNFYIVSMFQEPSCEFVYSSYQSSELTYDFSPATSWGNGIIDNLYIEIIFQESCVKDSAYNEYCSLINCRIELTGLPFKHKENKYTYQTNNFDLKTNLPIHIFNQKMDIVAPKKINRDHYAITSTSNVSQYPVANLSDGDIRTTWTGKTDDTISIKLLDNILLHGIGFVNGYQKSKQTYYNNNRIKKMELIVTIVNSEEITQQISDMIEFPDIPYQNLTINDILCKCFYFDFYKDAGWWNCETGLQISDILFIIKDIYKGEKYNDTCISELSLYARDFTD